MKKTIIAGAAASVALAAMPLVGVFAEDPKVVDNFSITVNKSCTFEGNATNSYTATMETGAIEEFAGKETTLLVKCNDAAGYDVTAAFSGLENTEGDDEIVFSGTTTPTANSGTWAAFKDAGNTPLAQGATVMTRSQKSDATGETAKITYKVSTRTDQEAGTYTGTATYTLTAKTTD